MTGDELVSALIASEINPKKGPPGPKGDRGEKGDPGPKGADGAPGAPGTDGADGPPGQPGQNGTTGPPGSPGEDGASVRSARALTLPPGSSADAAYDPATGRLTLGIPRGEQGERGETGLRGEKGAQGEKGPRGAGGLTQFSGGGGGGSPEVKVNGASLGRPKTVDYTGSVTGVQMGGVVEIAIPGSGVHPDLAAHDDIGLATDVELADHAAAPDPHPGYLTPTEGDAAYALIHAHPYEASGAVATHAAAGNPHPAYATDTDLSDHASDATAVHGIVDAADLIVEGDARLTDARTPTTHAASHNGGADGVTPAGIGAATSGHNHDAAYETTGAVSAHAGAADPHTGYQKESEKGAVGGYASLDGGGTVPDAQIPAAIARDSELHAEDHDHDGTPTAQLTQANTHQSPDTDVGPTSLHHTLGAGANQAATGNHAHVVDFGEVEDIVAEAFGDAAAAGATGEIADAGHRHAMPANPVTAHEAAGDPHNGYRLESADHTHASTGLQAGLVAHSALSGITANDHHAQSHSHASHTGIGTDDHHAAVHAASHLPTGTDPVDKFSQSGIGTADLAVANTETVVVSDIFAANELAAGMMFLIRAYATRAGTTSASEVIRIRIGTTTLTGNIAATLTPPASTLAQPIAIEGLVTIRTAGAGGTALGSLERRQHLAAVTITSAINPLTASVAVNTTSANQRIELTFISGNAANTYTFRNAVMFRVA